MTGKDIVLAVLIPLLLAEFGCWCGWLAGKIVPWAALLRYGRGERAQIRGEEWAGDAEEIPGQLTKLAYALGQLAAGSVFGLLRKLKPLGKQRNHTPGAIARPAAEVAPVSLDHAPALDLSTHTLGMPTDLRRRLEYSLPPGQYDNSRPFVRVTPRDRDEGRCAAWAADHYEVQAYYITSDTGSLGPLEDALNAVPGVYLTTQVHGHLPPAERPGNIFTNPAWPAALGATRRYRNSLRPQVIALISGKGA
jgi:hypothetical protein